MARLDLLQVLRFVAALGVVEFHVALNYGAFGRSQTGAMGVDVFFVLSGFIITTTARASPEGFLAKRAVRVLPPWWIWSAPWLIGAAMAGEATGRGVLSTVALWPATDVWQMPYLSVGWSLCFEVVFYFAVWLVLRGLKWWVPLLAYAVCAGLSLTGWAVFRFLGSPMVVEFLFGVGLAFLPIRSRSLGVVALVAGLAAIGYFIVTGSHGVEDHIIAGPLAWVRPLAWGLPAALIVFGAARLPQIGWRPLVFLGDASYSLYLTHMLTLALLVVAGLKPDPVVAVGLCVVGGALGYALVERPVLAILRALVWRRTPIAVPAS